MPQAAGFGLRDHLEVGQRRVQHRVPVHETLAAIDQPVLVQAHEDFEHGRGEACVHREAVARPVDRVAEPAHLARDRVARFLFPLPHALDEFLAAEVVPRPAVGGKLALDHHLRGDARVVGARLPEGAIAVHAVQPGQHVHQRVLEGMPHVQRARDVRRRDDDAVGRALADGREPAGRFPGSVDAGFDVSGGVALVHRRPRARTVDYSGSPAVARLSSRGPGPGNARR